MHCPCQRYHFGAAQPVNMDEAKGAFRELMDADAENSDVEVLRSAPSKRRYAFVALLRKGLAMRVSRSNESTIYRATSTARALNAAKTAVSYGDATAQYAGRNKSGAKVYNVLRANGKRIGRVVAKGSSIRWEAKLQSGAADSVENAVAFVVEATLPGTPNNPTIDNAPFGSKIVTQDGREITSAQAQRAVIANAVKTGKLFAYDGGGKIQTWDGRPIADRVRVISRQATPYSHVSNERVWMRFVAPWDGNRVWSGFTLGKNMYGRFRRTGLKAIDSFGADAFPLPKRPGQFVGYLVDGSALGQDKGEYVVTIERKGDGFRVYLSKQIGDALKYDDAEALRGWLKNANAISLGRGTSGAAFGGPICTEPGGGIVGDAEGSASWFRDEFKSPEDMELDFEQDEVENDGEGGVLINGDDDFGAKKKKAKKCPKHRFVAKVNGRVIGKFATKAEAQAAVRSVRALLKDARVPVSVSDEVIEAEVDPSEGEDEG